MYEYVQNFGLENKNWENLLKKKSLFLNIKYKFYLKTY